MPWFDWTVRGGDELGTGLMVLSFALVASGLVFSAVKGKWGFVLMAVLIPGLGTILSVIGGIRLAKPRSFWARHLYDRKTMDAAIERHEPPIKLEDYPEPKLRNSRKPANDNPAIVSGPMSCSPPPPRF